MAAPGAFRGPVVAVLSGGNIDPLVLLRVVRHGLASAGRFLGLRLRVDDRPGSLAALLSHLAASGGNVMHVSHVRTGPDLALHQVEVDVQLETKGPEHCAQVVQRLRDAGYGFVSG
jgi:threonine dehydratase